MIGANGSLTGYAGGLHNKRAAAQTGRTVSRSDLIDFCCLPPIWGASFLFMRVAAPEFGPFALIGLRSGLAACACGHYCWRVVAKRDGAGAGVSARS